MSENTSLKVRNIFVFGSNLAGNHDAGAALTAFKQHGAIYGIGQGLTGNSYAIPTKDKRLRRLSLASIKKYVNEFLEFAQANPTMSFYVTRIGCGLAGYTDNDIAPMFKGAPSNCDLPQGWRNYD